MGSPRHWDARLHAWVGGLPASPADRWLRRLSGWADHGVLWLVVAVATGARPGRLRRGALRGVGSMAASSALVNVVLKPVFRRARPELGDLHPDRLLRRTHVTPSFPSGHAASAGAFVTGFALECPPAGPALVPLALGVAYSRVHVGVHYPGDVVAGLGVGSALALAGRRVAGRSAPDDAEHTGVPR